MTPTQLKACMARFNRETEGDGFGVRVTLKSGREYHGCIYSPEHEAPALVMFEPMVTPTKAGERIDDGEHTPMFIDIAEIAAIAIKHF